MAGKICSAPRLFRRVLSHHVSHSCEQRSGPSREALGELNINAWWILYVSFNAVGTANMPQLTITYCSVSLLEESTQLGGKATMIRGNA